MESREREAGDRGLREEGVVYAFHFRGNEQATLLQQKGTGHFASRGREWTSGVKHQASDIHMHIQHKY